MELVCVKPTDDRALDVATEALQSDGALVLKDIVDVEFLRMLKRRMDSDTLRLLAYCESLGGNPRDAGQLQLGAPPFPPYLHADLLAHPFVWAIIGRLLGPEAGLMFYNGNTNCPASHPQHVHLDQGHKSATASAVRALAVGIPAQPTSARNGAIEIWPGTHTIVSPQRVPESMLAERRSVRPPIQPETALGDIVMRDARIWHRAVTNPSDDLRHMVSCVYHAQPKGPVTFDHLARPFVEGLGVNLNAAFTDQGDEYLFGPTRWLYEARDLPAGAHREEANQSARPLADI